MLGRRTGHRHDAHHRVLTSAAAATVLAVVAAGPGGTEAHAATSGPVITVSPADPLLAGFTEFTVSTNISSGIEETVGVFFPGSSSADEVGELTDNDGTLGGTFPAAGAVCGANTVTLKDLSSDSLPVIKQLAINTICPTIQIVPNTITFGSEPATIGVIGRWFFGSHQVAILIDGHQVQAGKSNSDGIIETTFPAAGLGCGVHQVTLALLPLANPLSPATSAGAPLTVTDCPTPPPTSPPPVTPPGTPAPHLTLTANPAVVPSGMTTHVTGAGFTPNAPVVLTWQVTPGPTGTHLLGGATVTADATGHIDTYLLVMNHDLLGPRQLVATQGPATADAAVLVEGGSVEPSSGDQLVFRR